jgi:metallo-beta-lactamase class B
MRHAVLLSCLLATLAVATASAAEPPLPQLRGYHADADWLQPVAPVRIADHTWQIGTQALTSLLIRTDAGAILIDGGLPQEADMLLAHMRALGVAPGDVKWILHSHAHIDHSGSLAAIKRATGAQLASNAESAWLLARGGSGDIHFGDDMVFAPVQVDRLLHDGESVVLGDTRLTVHFTPAHTPGSMSWTWTDTQDGKPLRIAYADSLSAPGYKVIDNPRYPRIVDDYRHGIDVVRALPCDVLLAPHADAAGWNYADAANPHPHPMTCRAYADKAAQALDALIVEQHAEVHRSEAR